MVFRLFFLLVGLLLLSCGSKTQSVDSIDKKSITVRSPKQVLASTGKSLTVPAYLTFLKELKGMTYDEVENGQLYLSLLYKPQAVEAALSVPPAELKSFYKKALAQKKGYHYVLINYRDKNPSITGNHPSSKAVVGNIISSLVVVKNQTDTLQNLITECVPSSVTGQPDQVILLIPESPSDQRLQLTIPGRSLGIRDLMIDLSMDTLDKFPALTL